MLDEEKAKAIETEGEGAPEAQPQETQPGEAEGSAADTLAASSDAGSENPGEGQGDQPAGEPERTFTQSQVNELVGKVRAEGRKKGYEEARLEMAKRYGVEGPDDLDSVFANGAKYDELNQMLSEKSEALKKASAENAMLRTHILPDRVTDVEAILAAKGLDVTEENINSYLPSHPEWQAKAEAPMPAPNPQPAQAKLPPQPTPAQFGTEPGTMRGKSTEEEEREMAMNLYFPSHR